MVVTHVVQNFSRSEDGKCVLKGVEGAHCQCASDNSNVNSKLNSIVRSERRYVVKDKGVTR